MKIHGKQCFLHSQDKQICKYYMAWKGMKLHIKSPVVMRQQFVSSECNAEDSCIKAHTHQSGLLIFLQKL